VPVEKCHTIMEKYGYTGSACIPMVLDDAIELGKIKRVTSSSSSVQGSDTAKQRRRFV
jgi:3-oxoacyl-[acyl-carrier-protein] synthase III